MSELLQLKNLGHSQYRNNQLHEARETYLKANAMQPNDLDVLIALGIISAKLEDTANTQPWLEQADALARSSNRSLPAIAYFYLGGIYRQQNEFDRAIEYFNAAISAHPDFPMAHLLLAGLYMAEKQLENAERHYQQVLRLQPDNVDAFANVAQVYEMLNQSDKAREAITKALALSADHAGALLALAKLEKREKNYAESARVLNRLIQLDQARNITAMATIELAQVLDKQKAFDAAFEAATSGKKMWGAAIGVIPFDRQHYQKRMHANKTVFNALAATQPVPER